MKKLFLTLVSIALFGTVYATPFPNQSRSHNSFIFNEQGVEFAIFKDGQFDFNVLRFRQGRNGYSNHHGINISFNTGYDYGAYIQYDNYGAVIQIENLPIFYDYYGRISQAGTVHINYDYRGQISWIGGMNIRYDHYNNAHCNGYVNRQHRFYTPSIWHSYYRAPKLNFCVTFNTPYRRHYKPIRYRYESPYRNNRRPTVFRNRQGQNRVATTRSNHSDRYKVKRDSRKSVTNRTRSDVHIATQSRSKTSVARSSNPTVRTKTVKRTKRTNPTTRPYVRKTTSKSTANRAKARTTSSSPKKRTKISSRIPNSNVVAQRSPRSQTEKSAVRRRK